MEEARFFAKALGDATASGTSPSQNSDKIKMLSKDLSSSGIPKASPATIERRLSLLALPSEVQTMVEKYIKIYLYVYLQLDIHFFEGFGC